MILFTKKNSNAFLMLAMWIFKCISFNISSNLLQKKFNKFKLEIKTVNVIKFGIKYESVKNN